METQRTSVVQDWHEHIWHTGVHPIVSMLIPVTMVSFGSTSIHNHIPLHVHQYVEYIWLKNKANNSNPPKRGHTRFHTSFDDQLSSAKPLLKVHAEFGYFPWLGLVPISMNCGIPLTKFHTNYKGMTEIKSGCNMAVQPRNTGMNKASIIQRLFFATFDPSYVKWLSQLTINWLP